MTTPIGLIHLFCSDVCHAICLGSQKKSSIMSLSMLRSLKICWLDNVKKSIKQISACGVMVKALAKQVEELGLISGLVFILWGNFCCR